MLQLFRHEKSPYPTAILPLRGLDADAEYVFTDVDGGASATYTGAQLLNEGYPATLPECRSAKILLYWKK
jgi:hypothetical protein